MAQNITKLPAVVPLVDTVGLPTQVFLSWVALVSKSVPIVGSGSPEGVLEAPQYSQYVDESTPSAPVLYMKMLSDISGDRSKGWYSV